MNNYEKLRKRINTLIPSRLELKSGCEVERDKKIYKVLQTESYTKYSKTDQDKVEVCGASWGLLPKKEIKILGQPLTIADVLVSLGETNRDWAISEVGDLMFQEENSSHWEYMCCHININLPLSAPENSEVCRNIYKLIKK